MTATKAPLATANVSYFAAVYLLALVAAPLWGMLVGFSGWAWLTAGLIWLFSGLSITAGYHRLWSHRSYQAAWPLKLFFVIFGTFSLQNAVLVWRARHRLHHRFVDDIERDPHCTFFINSLAHTWGKRHYSDDNTLRDNGWLALLTWGEGYHNFHHAFQAISSTSPFARRRDNFLWQGQ